MTRTTDQWEALLAGTTPAPWVIGATLKDPLVDVSAGTYEDANLAASAPAAVAEVVRLRREIDEIRKFVASFPLVPPLVGTGSTEARAYELQEKVIHALTRILEGKA